MPDSSLSSDFEDYFDYYDINDSDPDRLLYKNDPYLIKSELFDYREIDLSDVESIISKDVKKFTQILDLPESIVMSILVRNNWNLENSLKLFRFDPFKVLSDVNYLPKGQNVISISDSHDLSLALQTAQRIALPSSEKLPITKIKPLNPFEECRICFTNPHEAFEEDKEEAHKTLSFRNFKVKNNRLFGMSCGHRFCSNCWRSYFLVKLETHPKISQIRCMSEDCNLRMVDDFVNLMLDAKSRECFNKAKLNQLVESHPNLRSCILANCPVIVHALEKPKARKITCSKCSSEYCYKCGEEYHAPVDCDALKRWLIKCQDDGGTASYIAAHTKDCPNCQVCIEKNGGCNHMQCSKCGHDFCWMCLSPWTSHQSQYYACSKYSENDLKDEENLKTRESLQRYLFYYQRWENHDRSLRLEREQKLRIEEHISDKVKNNQGTWIDWQYLLSASNTLAKCRHTLKYTYPYAYYPNQLARIKLFEYQQALLEAEVEDLSWKIGHAEITDRADLQNKIDICEKHRLTLLDEFLTA